MPTRSQLTAYQQHILANALNLNSYFPYYGSGVRRNAQKFQYFSAISITRSKS